MAFGNHRQRTHTQGWRLHSSREESGVYKVTERQSSQQLGLISYNTSSPSNSMAQNVVNSLKIHLLSRELLVLHASYDGTQGAHTKFMHVYSSSPSLSLSPRTPRGIYTNACSRFLLKGRQEASGTCMRHTSKEDQAPKISREEFGKLPVK